MSLHRSLSLSLVLFAALPCLAQQAGPRLPGPPRIALIGPASAENLTLEIAEELEYRHGMEPKLLVAKTSEGGGEIEGLEALASADLAILYLGASALPESQIAAVRRYVESGRPVIVLGPSLLAPATLALDPARDLGYVEIKRAAEEAMLKIAVPPEADNHEIMKEIPRRYEAEAASYDVALAPGATVLMQAGENGGAGTQPVVWLCKNSGGGQVFATTLPDLKAEGFRRLFFNALFWLMREPIPDAPL